MRDEQKMFKADIVEPQTEQEFLRWFKTLVFADDLSDIDKIARFTDEIIIEGSGAIVKFRNGHTFEISVANNYKHRK